MMEIIRTEIPGVLRLQPKVFADERGHFLEAYNAAKFKQAIGLDHDFIQDNESTSKAGVLRGLHLQIHPFAQAKLVRVVVGAALDVCVDLRRTSPTFGKHVAIRLQADQLEMVYVPAGFAHGFLALEDDTLFQYKCSRPYTPEAERCILWNDADLGIDWGIEDPIVSNKDRQGATFASGAWEH